MCRTVLFLCVTVVLFCRCCYVLFSRCVRSLSTLSLSSCVTVRVPACLHMCVHVTCNSPFTQHNQLNNQLHCVNKHLTGCSVGLTSSSVVYVYVLGYKWQCNCVIRCCEVGFRELRWDVVCNCRRRYCAVSLKWLDWLIGLHCTAVCVSNACLSEQPMYAVQVCRIRFDDDIVRCWSW